MLVSTVVVEGVWDLLSSGRVHGLAILESALVLSGTALALVAAFRAPEERRWREIFQSRMIVTAGGLVIGGLVLRMLK
jgi:hypothetical protein